ncbi:putative c6 zinc finger domain containing protein [Phaeomoniella chlamydospora]|uniref:Putative c6 zinc finger domain containing protein n=1 Tax=Phaeomoniella chlamydospora TaxID=158046 RepID=A0A0G2GD89_PHACM|nr:putative c6 zinc finger domain containing protein [Phaeomoniella chlamydospora]
MSKSNTQISNANLATAIMLSSLEIISPSTFGISIPWQQHLNVARQIIHARYSAPQSISRKDSVAYFLSRWFAYLDVLGSLSGRTNDLPLFSGDYWAHDGTEENADEDFVIDCLLGMTPRCIYLMAQIASLARQCDNERISSTTNLADPHWRPSPTVLVRAQSLLDEVNEARKHLTRPCPHRHPSVEPPSASTSPSASKGSSSTPDVPACSTTPSDGWGTVQLLASNDSFHLAASIHIYRRILFLPRSHPTVQSLVNSVVENLLKIRKGGAAEACLLFPMFTAGCEALKPEVRELILERLKGMEEVGMMQVTGARRLMERLWEENEAATQAVENEGNEYDDNDDTAFRKKGEIGWEELLAGGEFFG